MSILPGRPASLRTYLGTAPGVGKTYAMLADGWRRAQDGQRVVIGWLEPHGRPEARAQRRDLEVVPPHDIAYGGVTFAELDVAAVLADQPDVVLVDELAHTHPDRSRRRWEDAAELLDAGVTVLTTLNVANLLTVRDYAARITGAGTVEFVPDEFIRAGEVILVDLPAEALRQRIAAGRVYSADRVGGALANYFRPLNLAALSELGRAWMAGTVETVGAELLARLGAGGRMARPAVVAGVSGSEWSDRVIRRAATLAVDDEADLVVVHVRVADGLDHRRAGTLDRYRRQAEQAGGVYTEVEGTSAADALAQVARDWHASRVVVARHRSRLNELFRGSVAGRIRRLVPDLDIDEVDREP